MSNNKLSKYLYKSCTELKGNKTYISVVLIDSKGKWVERKILQPTEKEVIWWAKSGRTCKEGYKWLKSNIRHKTKKLGNICVWLGTCDLTSKNKKYIALTAEDDQAVENAYEYLLKIAALVKDYPSCRITILEIPIYSIKEWNQRKGHKNLDEFTEQDKKLETQEYNPNGKIRQINDTNQTYSPNFSTDLVKNSKTAKGKKKEKFLKRKTNSFWLYVDGIHPGLLLARTWLKRLQKRP